MIPASGSPHGLIVAAPSSGSGKTVFTLGLLRHLARSGIAVASAKVGPDYLDPAFHEAATGQVCLNLDTWAMRGRTVTAGVHHLSRMAPLVVAEGVMGLFDGAVGVAETIADGSTASLARVTGWPVVLVVDVRGQAASAAAVVRGFATHSTGVVIAGVVFNRVGGPRHEAVLRQACAAHSPELPILGCLPAGGELALPSRHLGLVQAREHPALERFLDTAAETIATHVDIPTLLALTRQTREGGEDGSGEHTLQPLPPLGQRIAVARDDAFAFSYPAVLEGWRAQGAAVTLFSPLAGQPPPSESDAVYLPGGYPELHAGRLAGNEDFLRGLRAAAARGAAVYGECGGYMVLGRALIDAEGVRHALAGLLPVVTSFSNRRLHLGYRDAVVTTSGPLGVAGTRYRGHEFHYATLVAEETETGSPLFAITDAMGTSLGRIGHVAGSVVFLQFFTEISQKKYLQ
ncbi:MAG: cobyrinate a,c-diamide synthase, partial [Alphaproteobacteria bacterium]